MKIRLLILLSAIALFCVSCSDDCVILTNNNMADKCNTRIVSIEKFNAHFTVITGLNGKKETKLDSNYNIGMFKFPLSEAYSGSFPNDVNFESSETTTIAKLFFNNNSHYVTVEDVFPSNNDMPGDILVKDVNVNPADQIPRALLRINGYIVPLNLELHTEDAQQFCDYIKANISVIVNGLTNLEQTESNLYGLNLVDKVVTDYSQAEFRIYNKDNVLLGNINTVDIPLPPIDVLTKLQELAKGKSGVDFPVREGEFFGFITNTGKKFVFLVSEIRKSPIYPYRERVSIMFHEIY